MTDTEARNSTSVGQQAAAGVLWLTVQKWAVRVTGFVTIAILTRFLAPSDFGTVAAASTVVPFFFLIADLGFAAYIVQVEHTDQRMLSTGFWFSATAGTLLCLALIAAAPLLGSVFGSAQVTPVLQALSLTVLLIGVSSVPMALLRRRMQFKALAVQGSIAAVTGQVVAVAMTLTGAGVWALVGQTLTGQLVTAGLAWFAAKWRPSLVFSGADFAVMARFGSKVLGVEFIAISRTWVETAIISTVLGITALGYLNIAQRLIGLIQDLTGAALIPVTTVAFAKLRPDPARTRAAHLRALRTVYAVLAPPLTLVAVSASLIIPILFGSGWSASVRPAQILAIAGAVTVSAAIDHSLFYGLGRPGRWFWYALVVDLATVGMTAATVGWGLEAIAWGFLAVCVLATVARWFLVGHQLGSPAWSQAGPFGFLAAAVVVSGAAGWAVMTISEPLPALVRVALVGLAILAAHLGVTRLLARPVLDDLSRYLSRLNWPAWIPLPRRVKERS